MESKLKEFGALITYEYNTLIRGFAVTCDSDVMSKLQADEVSQESQYPFFVEVDQPVSVD